MIFAGYEKPYVKDREHRMRMRKSFVVVVFDETSPVNVDKNKFFSNSINKQCFINMLWNSFQAKDHPFIHAERDEDTLVVNKVLEIAQEKHVHTAAADDGDNLILLLYRSSKSNLIQSASQTDKIGDIQTMQKYIGEETLFYAKRYFIFMP